ncbi:TrkH family potassium uptake protein, partial [Aequoribacter sp.]|uniref:TrkH family potassium uptake protein n=1 Tax=Aequoribacter sp. TaxID=2847771 RepID=UPI003F6959E1
MRLFRPVFFVCGVLGLILASLMFAVAAYSWLLNDGQELVFAKSGMAAIGISSVLTIPGVFKDFAPTTRQLYMITTSSWLSLSLFAALPFFWSDYGIGFIDAVFEAVSGITTTGSTVLVGLRDYPPSILLWRSLLQWLGGLGVIGMAIAILPFLRVGGMRLFQAESSDWSEKSLPRFQSIAKSLWVVYTALTLCAVLAYRAAGMNWFDAVNHAMTTVSTGGFSTDDASMGQFGVGVLWVSTLFMFLGGLPFTLYIRLLAQKRLSALKDQQSRNYLLIVVGLVILLASQQWSQGNESWF